MIIVPISGIFANVMMSNDVFANVSGYVKIVYNKCKMFVFPPTRLKMSKTWGKKVSGESIYSLA